MKRIALVGMVLMSLTSIVSAADQCETGSKKQARVEEKKTEHDKTEKADLQGKK